MEFKVLKIYLEPPPDENPVHFYIKYQLYNKNYRISMNFEFINKNYGFYIKIVRNQKKISLLKKYLMFDNLYSSENTHICVYVLNTTYIYIIKRIFNKEINYSIVYFNKEMNFEKFIKNLTKGK